MFGRCVGTIKALDGVDFVLRRGETLGLVGESGCGKTTTARLVLRLEKPSAGAVLFRGRDVHGLAGAEQREYRRAVQAVFQDPYSSLNPRLTIRTTVGEPLAQTQPELTRAELDERIQASLARVGLRPGIMDDYPHELSGGQRQRVALARALTTSPECILLDEAVSALDVSIPAQVMNLLREIRDRLGVSYLFIAHDLAVVKYVSTRIGVMYLGKLVETGPSDELYAHPLHPYTQALLDNALPAHPDDAREVAVLAGEVPSAFNPPSGCRFHPRCPALGASLTLPTGTAPFPVVVLLHGCSGLQLDLARGTWSQLQDYAGWYAARGIAGLVLDSFGSRGVRHTCTGGEPGPVTRALDVYRALDHLGRQGVIDPGRAIVQGLSHGGSTVLAAMDERVAGLADVPLRLRGGIAYYPACAGASSRDFYAPVLILIGDKDDWTPAPPCEGLRAYQELRVPGRVRLVVYPDATHSFDFNSPRRFNEYGKLLVFDASATRDAQRRVEAFLAEVLLR